MCSEPDDTLFLRIVEEMEVNQGFLRHGLTLTSLTKEVFSNRSYVSHCINFYSGLSVPDFINCYRVRYVQSYLANGYGDPMPVQYRCGFSSNTTYIRNFRRFTGYTPMVWLAKKEFS